MHGPGYEARYLLRMFIKHPGNQATCTYRWPPLPHSKDPGSMHTYTHNHTHLYCTARTLQPLIAQRRSREWGYTHTHTHTHTRDGLIPIPNIRYRKYWLMQWWYWYVQALSTCLATCMCHTVHALSLRLHTLCHLRLPLLNMFLDMLTCSCSWTRTFE